MANLKAEPSRIFNEDRTPEPNDAETIRGWIEAASFVEFSQLQQQVADIAGGQTFQLIDRLGGVTTLGFNFPSASTNAGKWYDSFVEGTPVGTNAPSDDLFINGKVYSNGTDWVSIESAPVEVSDDIQAMLDFINEVVRGTTWDMRSVLFQYTGPDTIIPIIIDIDNRPLFLLDTVNQSWINALGDSYMETIGKGTIQDIRSTLMNFSGEGSVYPIIVDSGNRSLLEVNTETQRFAFALPVDGIEAGGGPTPSEDQPGGPLSPELRISFTPYHHCLVSGQSLGIGTNTYQIVSPTQLFSNRTFDVGPKASYAGDPGSNPGMLSTKLLVEDAASLDGSPCWETPCSGFAEMASLKMLTEQGIRPEDLILFLSTSGHSGWSISMLELGQDWFNVAKNQIERAVALFGAGNCAMNVITHIQGENEQSQEVPPSITASDWKTKSLKYFGDLQDISQAANGHDTITHVILFPTSNYIMIRPDIVLAQRELSEENSFIHLAPGMYHIPRSDTVHPTAVGAKWMGAYAGRYYSEIVGGKRPNWIRPLSAVRNGADIMVSFSTGFPLTLDRILLAPTATDGFRVIGDETTEIASVTIAGRNLIKITLTDEDSPATTLNYALDYLGTGLDLAYGSSGNLRDTCPDTTKIAGNIYPLFSPCAPFSIPIYTV